MLKERKDDYKKVDIFSKVHIFNAWILAIPVWLTGLIIAYTNPKGRKRAADMSWYRPIDKFVSFTGMFLMITFMILSVFIQLDLSSYWFFIGLPFVLFGFYMHIAAKLSYGNAESDDAVTRGVYRFSRNPMYVSISLILLGTVIASRSIILAILWFVTAVFTHLLIVGEERYCVKTYGESYRDYMKRVPRYLLFF